MASEKQASDAVVAAMVNQHRANTGRGESKSELQMFKEKVSYIAKRANPRIEQANRQRERKG